MLDFYNDNTLKIEYNPQNNKIAFPLNVIGPLAGETLPVYSGITPTDSNSIYVNDTTGSDTTGDGTSALPYATVLKGINSCTASKIYVIVQDSATYAEDLTTVSNSYFTNIYADTAQTPLLSKRVLGYTPTDSNTIFVNATTGNDTTGDGTSALPYATITKGSTECDATHQKVVITDSSTYTDGGIEFTGNFLGLYAQIGQAPTWTPDIDSDFNVPRTTASTFNEYDTRNNSTAVFSDDSFVIAYQDYGQDTYGKFAIYDSSGTLQTGPTTFNAAITDRIAVISLVNNNFVIAYRDDGGSDYGEFVIYDSSGTLQVGPTTFNAASVSGTSTSSFSDDSFVIAYNDSGGDIYGKFVIYDSSGTLQTGPTTFNAADSDNISTALFSDDSFVIAYQDDGGLDYGEFVIYDSSGTLQTGPTTFNAAGSSEISTAVFSDDSFVVAYFDYGGDIYGKFSIYDSSGTLQVETTTFNAYYTTYISASSFSDNNFVIAFRDTNESGYGKFVVYDISYYLVKVSASSFINGIEFYTDFTNGSGYMLYALGDLDIKHCEIKDNIASDYPSGTVSYAIYSDSEITMSNCSIHENGGGIYTVEDTSTIENSIFYQNTEGPAIHIDGAAASSGDITIEHCTLFQNNQGIKLENNNGTNEILKNLIIHNNDSYGIEADTAVTYSYSTNTDTLLEASAGSSVLLTNPLFKNEGALDVDDTDLNLKSTQLGDTTSSPALSLGDDSADAGGYNRIIIGSATTWTEITFYKPIGGFDVWTEPVTAVSNIRRDGSVSTSREALTEYVKITFPGISNADYIEALALLQATESQVRIYPDPVANPDDYNLYYFIYDTLQGSAAHYKLTRTGKQGITLLFARATE